MITFHSVKWKNFLSTGNYWTEIFLDRSPNTLVIGENGAGKSTMLDALCFGLFGKPFRKINKPQLLNSVNQKQAEVEISFTIGKLHYRIVRGLKPHIFEIYINDKLVDQTASARDYQEYLEKNILKLNYTSFTQIVILGSSTFVPFMQLPAHRRREIIEDLLDIRIFTAMNILLKEKLQSNKNNLNEIRMNLNIEEEKLLVHEKYIEEIRGASQKRIENMNKDITQSESTIEKLFNEIEKFQNEIDSISEGINDESKLRRKISSMEDIKKKFKNKIKKLEKEKEFFENTNVCPTCDQTIDNEIKDSHIKEKEKKSDEIEDALRKLETSLRAELDALGIIQECQTKITEIQHLITGNNNQISSLNKYIRKIQNDLKNEKASTGNIDEENEKIAEIQKLIDGFQKQRKDLLNEKEVLNVASDMLKDKGIKTQIVRQYIPVMNKLVNKYLAAMEFFVLFELDENFEEVIKSRHRDDFSYASFSEGEKMRIDLALLLTWRAIAKMKNSANTNLLILDEVFDASLDNNGCEEFLKLLEELGKDTNVFVISHKGDILQDKFRSVIRFEKRKNFSYMA